MFTIMDPNHLVAMHDDIGNRSIQYNITQSNVSVKLAMKITATNIVNPVMSLEGILKTYSVV